MKTPLYQPVAPPTAAASKFIATIAVILAAIVGLLLFDAALARVDATERKAYAAREFDAGEQLIADGEVEEGIERLRAASTLDGKNTAYGPADSG